MKKAIILFIIFATTLACTKQAPKDYVTLKGKILNKPEGIDTLDVVGNKGIGKIKSIILNADGSFSDTLKIKETSPKEIFLGLKGAVVAMLQLKNGDDLFLTGNFVGSKKEAFGTYSFTGKGAAINNYLAEFRKAHVMKGYIPVDVDNPISPLESLKKDIEEKYAILEKYKDKLAPELYEEQKKGIQEYSEYTKKRILASQKDYDDPLKGKVSPKFVNYENAKGGTSSLEDFKGKYVYIDLWATWCSPCIAQIPFLQKIEKEYHGKNIEFVSISTDKQKNREKWKSMVETENLGGVQLLVSKKDDKFIVDYEVKAIPRFILIDPKGNIVSSNAPRPSDPKLKKLLNSLPL